jgi:tetratricopeptide (TPR) repeat protein
MKRKSPRLLWSNDRGGHAPVTYFSSRRCFNALQPVNRNNHSSGDLLRHGSGADARRGKEILSAGSKKLRGRKPRVAFENYSRAIEISSHLDSGKPASSDPLRANKLASSDTGRVTVIDPFTAVAYTNRGLVRHQQNDLDGAIADFNAAIRISPGLAEAYLGRGVAYRLKGDREQALADFESNNRNQQSPGRGLYRSGRIAVGRRDLGAALSDSGRGAQTQASARRVTLPAGPCADGKKRMRARDCVFDQAIQLKPEMASAWHGRGTSLMKLSQFDRAIADFESRARTEFETSEYPYEPRPGAADET